MPEANQRNIREVFHQGYRIAYRVNPERIEIIMVVHGSRNLMNPENQRW